MDIMKKTFAPILHLLFPPLCRACGEPLDSEVGTLLCPGCMSAASPLRPPFCDRCGYPLPGLKDTLEAPTPRCSHCALSVLFFERARSAVSYESPFRELIHQFKFKGSWRVRPFLVNMYLEGFGRYFAGEHFDGVVPVPLHWLRHFQREFNQAEILARALSEAWPIPLLENTVRRVRYTTPQSRLSGRWRESHLEGAFVPGPTPVNGLNLLVVDDVMTTGMTLSACAEVLRAGGAASVTAYTLARRV